MTKQAPDVDGGAVSAPADAGAPDLVNDVAAQLTQWEGSDELAGEFAERLVLFFAGHLDELLQTKRELERSST